MAVLEPDFREAQIKQTCDILGCNKTLVTSGDIMLNTHPSIPYIVAAAIGAANSYYINDLGLMLLLQQETLSIVLQATSFRGYTLADKVIATKKFVAKICDGGSSATETWQFAISHINKSIGYSSFPTRGRGRGRGRGNYSNRGRGNNKYRGRGNFSYNNNNRQPRNNNNNITLGEGGDRNPEVHYLDRSPQDPKGFQPHVCTGKSCKHKGCYLKILYNM